MGLLVTKVELGNEFNDIKTNWLKHLKGEKIPFTIYFEIQTQAQAWADNEMTYAPASFTDTSIIQFETGVFDKFYAGDTIRIVDPTTANDGTYVIKQIIDNRTASLYTSDGVTEANFANAVSADVTLTVIDVIDKCRFNFNFIENDEAVNFFSKVTGSKQELFVQDILGSDTSTTAMDFEGEIPWQIGNVGVAGISITDSGTTYKTKFKITGNLYLTPFFLAEQWTDLQDGIAPPYFEDFNCLKLAYRIEASYEGRSPQYCQFYEESSVLGDSGWYSEKFNNKPTNYELESVTLTDSALNVITKLALTTEEQNFEAVIVNDVDDPFTTSTKVLVQFYLAPETAEEYTEGSQNMQYNFRHDRALQTVDAAAINGEQFGVAGRQVLTTIEASLDASDQITVTGKIEMHADLVTYLKTLDNPRYVLEVITSRVTDNEDIILNGGFTGGITSWTIGGATVYPPDGFYYNANKVSFYGTQGNNVTSYIDQDVTARLTPYPRGYTLQFTISGLVGTGGAAQAVLCFVIAGIELPITLYGNGTHTVDIPDLTNADTFKVRFGTASTVAIPAIAPDVQWNVDSVSMISYDLESNDSRVLLKISSDDFFIDLAPTNLITEDEQTYIEQRFEDPSDGIDNVKSFPEDAITAYSRIKFDLAETEYDVSIKKIRCGVRAKNTATQEEFDLDEQIADFAGTEVINDLEYIDLEQKRVFKQCSAVEDNTDKFRVSRDIGADAGDERYYDVYFPYMNRWEYWIAKTGVNADFFDTGEENNGQNEQWFRYGDLANWDLFTFVEVTVEVNGVEQDPYVFENEFEIQDYQSGVDWTDENIETFDEDDNQLINGGDEYILGYADTKVKATFTWDGAGAPPADETEVAMVFRLDTFENGGIIASTYITSWRAVGGLSQWKGTNSSGMIIITDEGAGVFSGVALIDYTKLSSFYKYSITARMINIFDIQT